MKNRFLSVFICVHLWPFFCLLYTGCGRYAEFTLPPLAGGDPSMTFAFDALPAPVLAPGEGWDFRDVLNPSVFANSGHLENYYSGFDGHTWHTGRAISADGLHWDKQGKLLSPNPGTWEGSYIAANGAALAWQGRLWYWYVAGPKSRPQIGLEGRIVLPLGPYGSFDEYGVSDPYVVHFDPYLYLFYTGLDRGRRQRLGVARSTDGIHWDKLRSNPILEAGAAGSSTKVDSANQPCGNGTVSTGCSTPAATTRKIGGWVLPARWTEFTGRSWRPSSRARKRGIPR